MLDEPLHGTPWKCPGCGYIDRRVESYSEELSTGFKEGSR
jgi:hypothetical protein